jgi:hypothetical protein
MGARRINQILWSVAALLGVAAAAVLMLAMTLPLDVRAVEPTAGRAAATQESSAPTLAPLEPVWNLRLRGELPAPAAQHEPRVASAEVAPAGGDGVPVTLVGTVGDSLAMLRGQGGTVEVRAVGETLDGVQVLEVRPARVSVRYNGRVVTLDKPPENEGGL